MGTVGCCTAATARRLAPTIASHQEQNLRPNEHVSAVFGSMSAARLQQHCCHAQDCLTHPVVQRLAGVGTAQNAHNGLMSLLVTCDILPLITRVDSDQMAHMVLTCTWIRLLRTYPVQFSLRLSVNIQSTCDFWSHFLAKEHTKASADNHFLLKLVVAGTGTREAYQVLLWKLCQAICWTGRYWCLGSFDHRLARADDGRRRWQPSRGW